MYSIQHSAKNIRSRIIEAARKILKTTKSNITLTSGLCAVYCPLLENVKLRRDFTILRLFYLFERTSLKLWFIIVYKCTGIHVSIDTKLFT